MASHKCVQELPINTLQLKQEQMANDISEIKKDMKDIKDFMYSMEEKYARKEELEKLDNKFWYSVSATVGLLIASLAYFLSQYFQLK